MIFLLFMQAYAIDPKNIAQEKMKNPESCLDRAYDFAVDKDKESLDGDRDNDKQYTVINAQCCCALQINNLFKEKTIEMTGRVNPAMDTLTESLRNQLESSDLKIKELVHLKYANSLYSFYDKDGVAMQQNELDMYTDGDGCLDKFTFRIPEKDRKNVYREGILKEVLAMLHEWKGASEMLIEKNMKEMIE